MDKKKKPLIIAIGGGKGGVGKSMVSSNLAVHYSQAGFKVVLLDLDFGAANLHTIFGIRKPSKSFAEYFLHPKSDLREHLIDSNLPNLHIGAGSGFVPELANLKYQQKTRLIADLKTLNCDLVLLDLAAGTSSQVIDFFTMTHAGVIVTTPEPTSMMNGYEFLKNSIYRILFRVFKDQAWVMDIMQQSLSPSESTSLPELIRRISEIDRWSAENIRRVCSNLNLYVILNQIQTVSDVHLGSRLYEIAEKHLNIGLNYAGAVFYDPDISTSVFKMRPISISSPDSPTTMGLKRIATMIISHLVQQIKSPANLQNTFLQQCARTLRYAESDLKENFLKLGKKRYAESVSGDLFGV